MVSRRRILQGVAGLGLLSGGVYAGQNGLLSEAPGVGSIAGGRQVGDSWESDKFQITPAQVKQGDELTIALKPSSTRSISRRKQITAVENGTLVAVELAIENMSIEPQTAPSWHVKNYNGMRSEDDEITIGGLNDIRLYAGDSGGSLPGSRWLQFPIEDFKINSEPLSPYPTTTNETGSTVPADGEIRGWIYGEIRAEGTPQLKITIGGDDVWWQLE